MTHTPPPTLPPQVDGRPRSLIRLYRGLEQTFGQGAAANFCVSQVPCHPHSPGPAVPLPYPCPYP